MKWFCYIAIQWLLDLDLEFLSWKHFRENTEKTLTFYDSFFQDVFVICRNPGLVNGLSTESEMQSELMEKMSHTRELASRNIIRINTYLKIRKYFSDYVQTETKKKHLTTLFTAYIEVIFLNFQHKIQLTDTSVISFKTDNLLKTIGKSIFW